MAKFYKCRPDKWLAWVGDVVGYGGKVCMVIKGQ